MNNNLIVPIIIIALVIIIVVWIISTYNRFISLRVKTDEAFSTMDIYLTKRHDLIPNLVETVKGYAKHEKSTLEEVIAARNSAVNAQGTDAKLASENQLTSTLKTLFAVSEAYPNLKADSQFINLQKQLEAVEVDIAQARKYYNAVIKQFNTAIALFPGNIIAGIMHLSSKPMYEVEDAEVRKNVKVQF